jgi:hypothetical protein
MDSMTSPMAYPEKIKTKWKIRQDHNLGDDTKYRVINVSWSGQIFHGASRRQNVNPARFFQDRITWICAMMSNHLLYILLRLFPSSSFPWRTLTQFRVYLNS